MAHKLPAIIEDNIPKIAVAAVILGGLVFMVGLIDGVIHATRLGSLIFSLGATTYIVEDSSVPRPRGTTMVSLAAFMLILEGSAQIMTTELTQTSYFQVVIGLYLMVTLWQMIRK